MELKPSLVIRQKPTFLGKGDFWGNKKEIKSFVAKFLHP